jgi:glycosyltransferase involved in cell wall biosynthesis
VIDKVVRPLRILQLTHKFPFPYHDGGAIAVRSLAEGLQRTGVSLDLFSLNTDKHRASQETIQKLRNSAVYRSVLSSEIKSTESISGALLHLISKRGSYYIDRFYNEKVARELLSFLKIQKYDAIILESLYLAPYIEVVKSYDPSISMILRAHNIESELRIRQREEESNIIKKVFLNGEIRKLRKYELAVWDRVDLIATVSEREAKEIRRVNSKCSVISIPIGMVAGSRKKKSAASTVFKIGFIGSLDWEPNLNGLRWFVDEVWSQMSMLKNVSCSIAGAHSEGDIDFIKDENIEFAGGVPSSKEYLESLDVLIVPLFSGSGTRVKILEAMSLGVPVLSTTLGAEGVKVNHSVDILIGDTAEEWIDILSKNFKNPIDISEIGNNAMDLIRADFNIEKIGEKLSLEIQNVIEAKMRLKNQ